MSETVLHQHKFIDVVKYRWIWFGLSLLLVVPGLVAMIYSMVTYPTHFPVKVGIDFTGGTITQYSVSKDVSNDEVESIRNNLIKAGIENPVIQVLKANNAISKAENIKPTTVVSVKTAFKSNDIKSEQKIGDIIRKDYPDASLVQVSSIGPSLGKELFTNSLYALALAFLGIVVYLSFRFQVDYAVIALISLAHDALFVLGFFSILGIFFDVHIDALFITAVLTVIGFSNHDTIVVFDRIRENCRFLAKKATFPEIVNASVNQTLARSINTSLTTLITLTALYIFGGETTKEFVLAMIVGIAIGTYSSIFFASTLLDWWRERQEAPKNSTPLKNDTAKSLKV
ncbi:MAG: protein translocase subunit SecF [Clostridium sp.]|nr:protein translocase subunit SecF [Clostridium sp.]